MSSFPSNFDPKKLGWRFLFYLPQFVRLFWRLFKDQRVSLLAKAVLVLAAGYVLMPIDLIPDITPYIGRIDDLGLVILACRIFLTLCPREVVAEHVRRISDKR